MAGGYNREAMLDILIRSGMPVDQALEYLSTVNPVLGYLQLQGRPMPQSISISSTPDMPDGPYGPNAHRLPDDPYVLEEELNKGKAAELRSHRGKRMEQILDAIRMGASMDDAYLGLGPGLTGDLDPRSLAAMVADRVRGRGMVDVPAEGAAPFAGSGLGTATEFPMVYGGVDQNIGDYRGTLGTVRHPGKQPSAGPAGQTAMDRTTRGSATAFPFREQTSGRMATGAPRQQAEQRYPSRPTSPYQRPPAPPSKRSTIPYGIRHAPGLATAPGLRNTPSTPLGNQFIHAAKQARAVSTGTARGSAAFRATGVGRR